MAKRGNTWWVLSVGPKRRATTSNARKALDLFQQAKGIKGSKLTMYERKVVETVLFENAV